MVALASLQLRVDATQPGQAARTLDSLTASGQRAETQADKLANAHNKLSTETRQTASAATQLGAALGALGAAALVRDTLLMADAYTSMQSRLKLATGSAFELAQANERLFAVGNRTRVGLEATVDLYASLSRSTQQLGMSQERLVGVTETINKALIVSGASAGAAQAALTQLGQGLASGTLRGDELNSVLEQTPRLAKAIADGMGITVGQLRALGAEGKITGAAIIGALEGQAGKISAEFDQMEMTIGQAFTKIQNSVTKYVGDANQAAGVTREIAEAMSLAADNIDVVAKAAGVVAGVIGVALVGSMVRYAAVTLAATASNIALGAAIGGMSVRAAAGALAMRGLSASMAFFGGPIGLAITGVAAAIALVAREATASERAVGDLDSSIRTAREVIEHYGGALDNAATNTKDVGVQSLGAVMGIVEFGGKAGLAATNLFNMAAGAKAAAIETVRLKIEAMEAEVAQAKLRTREGRRQDLFTDYGNNFLGAAGSVGRFFVGEGRALLDGGEADRLLGNKVYDSEKALAELYKLQSRQYAASTDLFIPATEALAAANDDNAKKTKKAKDATDEAAVALKRATTAAQDYLAALSKEVRGHNKPPSVIKGEEVAAQVEAAPTPELKAAIREQGEYAVGILKSAEAVRELNAASAEFKTLPIVDFKGDKLEDVAAELRLIDGLAYDAGRSLEMAFGRAGGAIGDLLTTLTNYRSQMADIEKAVHENLLTQEQGIREGEALRIRSYGNMAAAGREFFEEGSKGYEIMAAAEKAFRIVEFGFALQAITMKGAEATATVTTEATKTGATLAGTGVRTAAKAAEGIAGIFAALGPFAFPVAAAATAVMVAAGVKMVGSGGGAVPGATDMEDRQNRQGTGSVLGDGSAKSGSIAKALDIVAANSNRDLEYSNAMLKSLRGIESGIGVVAAGLARSLSAGGSLSTDGLNLGSSTQAGGRSLSAMGGGSIGGLTAAFVGGGSLLGPIGAALGAVLGPMLFKTTTTRTLQDQGLQFGSQNLGNILSGGIEGQTYQQVLENTKKKFLGMTYSDKNKVQTTTGSLDVDLANQITALIGSLKSGVLDAASVLGVTGAEATLDAFKVELGKLSFKDMSGAEIQDALSAIFGKLGDDLAATAIPELRELQKVGEGAFETLARVARQYQVVDISLTSIGMTFGAVGVSSLKARERLVDMVGSIDELAEQAGYFAENFLSDLERMAPIQRAVTNELARLGLVGVDTKDEFKNVVLGLDLTTEAGAKMYAALMDLAPAFAKVIDFQAEGSKAVQNAHDALSDAYEREAGALENTRDKFKDLAKSLKEFGASLDPLLDATTAETYARTEARFASQAALAKSGDAEAMAGLQSSAQDFLQAAKANAGSLLEYQVAVATVQGAVKAAEQAASSQATLAEQQLSALNASVAGILTVNTSVLSVRDALAAYLGARAAQEAAATAPPPAPNNPTGQTPPANDNPTPATRGPDWASYVVHYADVAAEYARNMASAKGRAELARLGVGSLEAFGAWHWDKYGQAAGRTPYAAGGIMDRPITLGESGIGGEAGPEGILPLANVGGKLGVHSVGGSDSAQLAQMYAQLLNMNAALISIARSTHELNRNFRRVIAEGLHVRGPEPDAPVQTKAVA